MGAEAAGILTTAEVAATVGSIAAVQLPDGSIPWFPEGHTDPWNHVEAAMALDVGGLRAEAERAYEWLAAIQRPDGAWHRYYRGGAVEDPTLDANACAYVATGIWHHYLATADGVFLEALWPVMAAAVDFTVGLQTRRGEIIWARHADGTPWSFALLTGSASIYRSLRCAVAVAGRLGRRRPDWERAAASLATVVAGHPGAFAPKDRWAMDWYYPVLAGVVGGVAGRDRLQRGWAGFVMEGWGVRCVSDRPWVTAAETSECVLAHLAVGAVDDARRLFAWTRHLRHRDGSYFTGMVHPDRVHFPGGERSTYSAAAVVLAADALAGAGPTSRLFTCDPVTGAVGTPAQRRAQPPAATRRSTRSDPSPAPSTSRNAPEARARR